MAFFLVSRILSVRIDTTVSSREMDEVRAAKNTSRKNMAPTAPPSGKDSNTLGSTPNISPGPAFPWIRDASPPLKADHKSCQKSDPRIEDLDLAHGTLQIILFFHIGAIGDHDPHG